MRTVNIHHAKTHLSRLVEKAVAGEPFIIAKAGKPLVQVTALDPVQQAKSRVGFMAGEIVAPDDFDTMMQDEIIALFEGDDEDPV